MLTLLDLLAGSQQPDGSMPVRQFLQTCAAVINREPTTFFEAVLATCTIRENNGRPLVVLKKAKVRPYSLTSSLAARLQPVVMCFCSVAQGINMCRVLAGGWPEGF